MPNVVTVGIMLCCSAYVCRIHCMQKLQQLRSELDAEQSIQSMFDMHNKDYFDHLKSVSESEKSA